MKTPAVIFLILLILTNLTACSSTEKEQLKAEYAAEIEESLTTELLNPWYPEAIDEKYGGFLSSFEYNFEPGNRQVKMIVSQARHVWVNSKAAIRYPETSYYRQGAENGFQFLKDYMWDEKHGGFHTMVNRQGELIEQNGAAKTAYGNAFSIYGLAAYFEATGDEEALELAKDTFLWLEEHSHDREYMGYFQHLEQDGTPIQRSASTPSTSDLGYKDQNSSIHLLEAFTELYRIWPDDLLRERLLEMHLLIRDTITQDFGSMTLFFEPDWTSVSFQHTSREEIERHHYLEHVSFGHDVETAFLLTEASHVLGLENDQRTDSVAKKMVDHALKFGFDEELGGFYDAGYYFEGEDTLTITRESKNWWAQAEGLNALLMMAEFYPNDEQNYFQKFEKQWEYIDQYLIDHEHGGWFEGGTDEQPEVVSNPKGHIWKTTYHNYRAMTNVVDMLQGNFELTN